MKMNSQFFFTGSTNASSVIGAAHSIEARVIEARVIKQHLKSYKMHLMERRYHLHPNEPDPTEGVTDIRMLL